MSNFSSIEHKMANPWIVHIKKTMKQMKARGSYAKGKGLSQVIKEAKKTWKKGGASHVEPAPAMSGGKTRKRRSHGRK